MQSCNVSMLQCCNVAKLPSCNLAMLQSCKIAKLQNCKVAMLQSCKVAMVQWCNVAMLQCCNVAMLQSNWKYILGMGHSVFYRNFFVARPQMWNFVTKYKYNECPKQCNNLTHRGHAHCAHWLIFRFAYLLGTDPFIIFPGELGNLLVGFYDFCFKEDVFQVFACLLGPAVQRQNGNKFSAKARFFLPLLVLLLLSLS